MLKLSLFSNRRFSIAALGETLGAFGLLGALFVQTQFLQFDLGYSPLQAGLRILPIAATLVCVAAFSPFFARLIGVKFTVAAGLAAIAGGLWQISARQPLQPPTATSCPGCCSLVSAPASCSPPQQTLSSAPSSGDSGLDRRACRGTPGGRSARRRRDRSTLATRYQGNLTAALSGHPISNSVRHDIVGSLGGALAVAQKMAVRPEHCWLVPLEAPS